MTVLLELLLLGVAIALFVPALVLFFECLVALVARPPEPSMGGETPSTVVLVPAHDEEAGLAATLASIQAGLSAGQRIVVIADNCQDRTAEVARSAGVEVIERTSATERGKGYALVFGLDHLAAAPPEVVIVIDADCRVPVGSLPRLAAAAKRTNRPAQAEYLLEAPADPTPVSRLSGFAVLFKNRVRPLGLWQLGLPVHLTGSGMAFPYEVLRKAPPTGAYLVEDMLIGVELARLGHPPGLCPDVTLTSALPSQDDSGRRQRRRWEHGHLETLSKHGPALLRDGLTRQSLPLLAMGLDLMVPPLAFFVLLLAGVWVGTGALAALGLSSWPFHIVNWAFGLVALAVALGWARYGRAVLPPEHLLAIPKYIAWKIPLYLSFLKGGAHRAWERTDREP